MFKFGDCPVGQQIDALCTVNNESASLPVTFSLHSTAHYHSSPSQGHINPGQSVDVLLSFTPNQMGTFKPVVSLEVLGGIVEDFSFDADPTAVRYIKQTPLTLFFLASPLIHLIKSGGIIITHTYMYMHHYPILNRKGGGGGGVRIEVNCFCFQQDQKY